MIAPECIQPVPPTIHPVLSVMCSICLNSFQPYPYSSSAPSLHNKVALKDNSVRKTTRLEKEGNESCTSFGVKCILEEVYEFTQTL